MDLSQVTAALGAVVLERVGNGRFLRASAAPAWWRHRADDDRAEPIEIADVFPFLSTFLREAERVWSLSSQPPIGSDLWTEIDANGREFHLEAFATRAGDTAVLVIARNDQAFTDRQLLLQRARDRRSLYDELMREIEGKDILLHTIVHDLTAPLHSIVGALSLLREMQLPPTALRWTQLATEAAARQRELIKGILDVFVSEQGHGAAAEVRSVTLEPALQQAITEREPVARMRQVNIVARLTPELTVSADATRLVRVVTNLLDNAIRHSPPGKPVRVQTAASNGNVLLTVEDEGPGVPADLMPRLFQKLVHDPRGGGTGLGLYFCRITVEQWGGGIGYEPRPGGGARFWIRLPAVAADTFAPTRSAYG